MIQMSRNLAVSSKQLWLLSFSASYIAPKNDCGYFFLWAEHKTVLIALGITTLDEPSYRLNDS